MTNAIENERRRVADRAADSPSVNREACRRAFHQEPEERVCEAVRWALSERNLPGHDPELMIEDWAASATPASTARTVDARVF